MVPLLMLEALLMLSKCVALLLFPFTLRALLPLSQWQAVEAGHLSCSCAALLLVALGAKLRRWLFYWRFCIWVEGFVSSGHV